MFGNEKSQKLNLNNLKSKRPIVVRENEAVSQKMTKTMCVTAAALCGRVCAPAGMSDFNIAECVCTILHKHHMI